MNQHEKNDAKDVSKDMSQESCTEELLEVEKQEAGAQDNDQKQEIDKLKVSLEICEVACNAWQDKYMHVSADLQNFKRRVEKEQVAWARQAKAEVLLNLLAIVDDFDRALSEHHKRERTADLDNWFEGFELIGKSLYKFLHQMDVTEIDQMSTFDHNLHEAIVQVDSDKHTSGDIVDVIQKGFMFNGEVLRPARVTVAK